MSRALDPPAASSTTRLRSTERRRRVDHAFVIFCMATALVSVVVLAVLLGAIFVQGLGLLSWRFLTSIPDPEPGKAGILPALAGTLWVCLVCALFSLPIGVATAVLLEEYKPRHPAMRFLHALVQLNITNLAGVPSVVYGIIGVTAFVAMFGLFGQPGSPSLEIGVQWFDQYGAADSDKARTIDIPVAGYAAPTAVIAPGIEGETAAGWEPLRLIGAWDPLPTDPEAQAATIRRGSQSKRIRVGDDYFDEFPSLTGAPLRVRVARSDAPPTMVRPPLKAVTSDGETVYVKILDSDAVPTVSLRTSASPERVAVDGQHYDRFTTRDEQQILIPVKERDAPPTAIRDGQSLRGFTANRVSVRVGGLESGRPSAFNSRFDTMLRADPQAGRIPQTRWYYFRLPIGRGVLAGGLTLMLVILPVVIIAAQESLRAVPWSLREGALGMGATQWQVVWNVTLPASVPGIMTGSILAMSRAIGEAAPILIICGIVFIGYVPGNLMDKFTVMPLQIYNWASQPDPAFQGVAATGIIVLLAALLTFNGIAVFIRQRMQKPLS